MSINTNSLRFKLITIFIISIIVFMVILIYLVSSTMKNSKLEEISEHRQSELIFVDQIINRVFKNLEEDLITLSKNDVVSTREDAEFTSFLNADENTFQYNIGELEQTIINVLNNHRISHEHVNSVYMGRENGSFVRSHPRAKPTQYDPRERPWYILAKENQAGVVMTDPYKSVTTDDINIGFEMALIDESGAFYGVIGMDVTLIDLTELLTSYVHGTNDELMLINDQGIILASNNEEHLFTNHEGIFNGDSLLLLESDNGSFSFEDKFIVFFTSPTLGWKLISVIPQKAINADVNQTVFYASAYFLGASLSFGILIYFLNNSFIFKPIIKLDKNINQMNVSGTFTQIPVIKRKDEIGRLSNSFSNLISMVINQKSELAAFNEQLEKKIRSRTKQLNKTNQKLKTSEQKYRSVVEDSAYKIFRWTKDGTIVFANTPMLIRDGGDGEVLVGMNIFDLLKPEIAESLKEKISKLSLESPTIDAESRYLGKDGEWHWEEWTERGIFDDDGNLLEIQSTGKDISDLKKAYEIQRKLSSAIHHSPVTVVVTDHEGIIEYANPKFVDTTGYSVEEAIGNNPSVLKSGLHDDDFYKELWDTIKSGQVWNGEFTNKRKNGDLYIESASIAPIKDEAGKITHFVAVKEDITEQKEVQNAIQESETRLKNILNYSPIVVFMNDLDGRYIYVNDEFAKIEEFTKEEIIGKTDSDLYSPELAEIYESRNSEVINTRKVQFYKTTYGKGDNIRNYTDTILPLINNKGEIYATCGWSWDITDQTNVEAAMEKARIAAENANLAKSSFVANMSHEIRTPLNAISGMIYLLGNTNLKKNQKNMLANINSASDALMNIINDILDFSKIEAGKMEIENIEFNLRSEIVKFANVIGFKAQAKGLNFNISINPDVPEKLIGDPTRLIQILTNLAGNAVKFTEKGEVFIEIEKKEQKEDDSIIQFSVQDTGIGMSEKAQKNLFKPFTQAEISTTRKFGGTGLGLSISKMLVENMGGRMDLISKPGKGSTFFFQIPYTVLREEAKQIIPNGLCDTTVFVVENSPNSLKAMVNLMTTFRVQCEGVDSLSKALRSVKAKEFKKKYDLMVFNTSISGNKGLSLLQKIIKESLFEPENIIALINYGQENSIKPLEQLGVSNVILNPPMRSTMYEILLTVMGVHRDIIVKPDTHEKIINNIKRQLKNTRILIVEDNEINQLVTTQLLEHLNISSDIATNGEEAVRMVAENKYDAVLMDLQMPVMDGIEATRAIRSESKYQELPIIALTADVVKEIQENIFKVGMNDFLTKPINVADFHEKLLKWIKPAGREKKK